MSLRPSTMEVHSAVDSRDFLAAPRPQPPPFFRVDPGVIAPGVDA